MKAYVAGILEQFDSRSVRERILIGLTVFAVTWAVWLFSIGGIVIDNRAEVITSIDRLAQDLQRQSDERQRLQSEDPTPVRNALQKQEQQLEKVIVAQQEELDELLTRFIAPEDVPQLLEDVLRDYEGLKLIRLSSMPAQPLLLQTRADAEEDEQNAADAPTALHVEIFRHPVQLVFEGGYMDVLAYLTTLESGEWQFAWRRLEYTVGDYPKAEVLIEVETLSREKEWLGV